MGDRTSQVLAAIVIALLCVAGILVHSWPISAHSAAASPAPDEAWARVDVGRISVTMPSPRLIASGKNIGTVYVGDLPSGRDGRRVHFVAQRALPTDPFMSVERALDEAREEALHLQPWRRTIDAPNNLGGYAGFRLTAEGPEGRAIRVAAWRIGADVCRVSANYAAGDARDLAKVDTFFSSVILLATAAQTIE